MSGSSDQNITLYIAKTTAIVQETDMEKESLTDVPNIESAKNSKYVPGNPKGNLEGGSDDSLISGVENIILEADVPVAIFGTEGNIQDPLYTSVLESEGASTASEYGSSIRNNSSNMAYPSSSLPISPPISPSKDKDNEAPEEMIVKAEDLSTVYQDEYNENISFYADPELYDHRVPYIQGFSNGEEITELCQLSIKGALPSWLNGALYRIGPGLFDIEYISKRNVTKVFSFEHWNDGLTLVHRYEIDGNQNRIRYRSRFTCNTLENTIREYARNNKKVHGTDPNGIAASKHSNDPTGYLINMNIMPDFPLGRTKGGDHLVCLTDANLLQEIDPVTLIPKRVFRYNDINSSFQGDAAPAIPQRDESHKETISYSMVPKGNATYNIFSVLDEDQFDPPGHLIASVNAKPSYSHSFAITKSYIIIVVYPYTTGLLGSLKLYWTRNYRESIRFDSSSPTYFYVIDREKRDVICVYQSHAFFALNILNSWEDADGSICLDVNAYKDDTIIHCFSLRNLRTMGMPPFPDGAVRRYVLNNVPEAAAIYKLKKNDYPEASHTFRTDFSCEYPRINPNFHMKPYRYAYGISISTEKRLLENSIWDSIVKADLTCKKKIEWKQEGCYPGEPMMIPRPSGTDEDDGVILSVVLNSIAKKSFLLVLNAKTLEEVCRADTPVPIPFGFHGSWTKKIFG